MEKELYREQLARLLMVFPGREVLTINEVCSFLHIDRRTLLRDKNNPAKKIAGKYVVPLVNLARYLS